MFSLRSGAGRCVLLLLSAAAHPMGTGRGTAGGGAALSAGHRNGGGSTPGMGLRPVTGGHAGLLLPSAHCARLPARGGRWLWPGFGFGQGHWRRLYLRLYRRSAPFPLGAGAGEGLSGRPVPGGVSGIGGLVWRTGSGCGQSAGGECALPGGAGTGGGTDTAAAGQTGDGIHRSHDRI